VANKVKIIPNKFFLKTIIDTKNMKIILAVYSPVIIAIRDDSTRDLNVILVNCKGNNATNVKIDA
jgi:hypothetical protein